MSSLNKVCLIGFVGNTPEIRKMNNGKEVASFSLATTESWKAKDSSEWKSKTEWHRIVVFNEGLVKYIKGNITKGMQLYIEGSIATRKYEKNGQDVYTTEIVLQGFSSMLKMLGSKPTSDKPSPVEKHTVDKGNAFNDELDDNIPF